MAVLDWELAEQMRQAATVEMPPGCNPYLMQQLYWQQSMPPPKHEYEYAWQRYRQEVVLPDPLPHILNGLFDDLNPKPIADTPTVDAVQQVDEQAE